MSAGQVGTILAGFLIFILAVLFKWEIPFDIGDAWLKIIGGFPCLLYSSYINYKIPIPRTNFSHTEVTNFLDWNCNRLDSQESSCLSTLAQCPIEGTSQFSFDYWDRGNTTCKKAGRRVECVEVTFINNTCQNIVTIIGNYSNGVELQLEDFELPASILQTFETFSERLDGCYRQGDMLEVGSPNNRNSLLQFPEIRFEINNTVRKTLFSQDCNALKVQMNLMDTINTFLCNCGKCDIVVYNEDTIPNGTCVVPVKSELVIPTKRGRIIGAILKQIWTEVDPLRSLSVTQTISFPPYTSTTESSRFWAARGRFYCPSEVSCWEELWYPLKQWKSLEGINIALLLIIASIIALALSCRK